RAPGHEQSKTPYPAEKAGPISQLLSAHRPRVRVFLPAPRLRVSYIGGQPVKRAILRGAAALALLLAFGLVPAAAQTGQMFGELVGKVTDDQGGVLPGVTVTLSGPAAMGTPTSTTNAQGLYRFPAVSNGTYTLKFELAGFAPMVR